MRRATKQVKRVTQGLARAQQDLHWRYDVLSSRRFPIQYYAVALRGSGPDADEVLVIGIECFESSDGYLVVSAMITGEDGVILAESPTTKIKMPSEAAIARNSESVVRRTVSDLQSAFDSKVDWANAQQGVIRDALQRASP